MLVGLGRYILIGQAELEGLSREYQEYEMKLHVFILSVPVAVITV